MAEVSVTNLSAVEEAERLDAQYFRPKYVKLDNRFDNLTAEVLELRDIVTQGYRVVYENTNILNEKFDPSSHVYFVQSSDILDSYPAIDTESVGWVSKEDLYEYPKGVVNRGEILVEVKGKAEKVVLVPNDFPKNTLITGTLYKIQVDESIVDPAYVALYLLSDLGKTLRDRGKSNTIVSYVSKSDLYDIRIPILPREKQEYISELYYYSREDFDKSVSLFDSAKYSFCREIGLENHSHEDETSFSRKFSSLSPNSRLDASFYRPKYQAYHDILSSGSYSPLSSLSQITSGNQARGDSEIPYVSIKDFEWYDLTESETADPSKQLSFAAPHDLLLAVTGATIGKVAINTFDTRVAISGDLISISPSDIDPFYLLTVLSSPPLQSLCKQFTTGSTNEHLAPEDVAEFPIPRLGKATESQLANLAKSAIDRRSQAKTKLGRAKDRLYSTVLDENGTEHLF